MSPARIVSHKMGYPPLIVEEGRFASSYNEYNRLSQKERDELKFYEVCGTKNGYEIQDSPNPCGCFIYVERRRDFLGRGPEYKINILHEPEDGWDVTVDKETGVCILSDGTTIEPVSEYEYNKILKERENRFNKIRGRYRRG